MDYNSTIEEIDQAIAELYSKIDSSSSKEVWAQIDKLLDLRFIRTKPWLN